MPGPGLGADAQLWCPSGLWLLSRAGIQPMVDEMLAASNQPRWEHLYLGTGQIQEASSLREELVVKHLPAHPVPVPLSVTLRDQAEV